MKDHPDAEHLMVERYFFIKGFIKCINVTMLS